ncbi:TNFAIP3-interacting protein 3 [Carcharodon carcharias]|uniref:TNFAIP3-interacting protein 3 n=1 Tax=Carcharodon carcharias TaxID=13397 RepID=UPI001B7ECD95|nr:TNFAIP3-interacting protein 3 [Carcharodon carcharias]XP_041051919.1 TNFAIP3-interacting protein 3 [Carcharodon carcharias]XP_041051920.1 TNFAIP3-interacting protein 3 [Carcharodon carcharias]
MEGQVVLLPHSAHSLELQPILDKASKIHQGEERKDATTAEITFGENTSRTPNEPFQLIQNVNEFGAEENVIFITESMSVTTADEEKLLLLNRNTELRRMNKELMKLNQDWDQIYRATTTGLQQKVTALQMEVSNTNQHANALSKKLDNEQRKREYYEQSLIQEMKRNQQLQEYVRQLESKLHSMRETVQSPLKEEPWRQIRRNEKTNDIYHLSQSDYKDTMPSSPKHVQVSEKPRDHSQCRLSKPEAARHITSNGISQKECKELRDQMLALVCQTKLYESDYKTERKDRQRTQAENEKLRKKTDEMYLQMNLLQQQLKIYEDDFKRERSDKEILQRLLKSKSESKEPVLVHRCNNTHQKSPEIRRLQCGKHCIDRHTECSNHHRFRGAEIQAEPYSIDYH